MRTRKTYRPIMAEALEDRAVPSADYGWLTGLIGLGPTSATQAVGKAFGTFEKAYENDVFKVLYATGGPSATTRTAFNTQVGTDLQTLEASIATALGNGNASLNTTIDASLTGSAATSLQSMLTAMPTPPATGHGSSAWVFVGKGEWDIAQSAASTHTQVQTATAPTGTIDTTTVGTILTSVNKAFGTFDNNYVHDLTTILYANGGPTATTRTAFDTQVGKDIATLNGSVTAALTQSGLTTPLPSSLVTSLTTTLTNDLETPATGATGASLQEHLAAIKTPSNNYWSKLWFRINTSFQTGRAEVQVYSDIINAVKGYNQSLPLG
jgi:hypothetical protein